MRIVHCVTDLFYEAVNLKDVWAATGSDHDIRSIYCNKFYTPSGGPAMCDYTVEQTYTKRAKRIFIHPDYPNPLSSKSEDRKTLIMRKYTYDVALLEVDPFVLSDELNILPGCLSESNNHVIGDLLLVAGAFFPLIFGAFDPFGCVHLATFIWSFSSDCFSTICIYS